MIVQEPVQAAIWHCLNHYDYSDAVFLSERLYAEVKTDESLYLLATSYYRSGQKAHAYHTLKERCGWSPQCQLLFGNCAYEIQRYAEAESCILDREDGSTRSLDDVIIDFADQAAFALLLLGKIAAKTERKSRAIEALKKTLKINPFLFSAFEDLCKIGGKPNPNNIFQVGNIENLSLCHGHSISNIETVIITTNVTNSNPPSAKSETPETYTPQQIVNNFNPSLKNQRDLCTPEESPLANPLCMSGIMPLPTLRYKTLRAKYDAENIESPAFGQLFDSPGEYNGTPTSQPTLTESNNHQSLAKRMCAQVDQLISRNIGNIDSILQNYKPVFSQSSNVPAPKTPTSPLAIQPSQNVRRSSRLFSSYSVKENNKSPTRNKFATPKSPSRKTKQRIAKNINNKNLNGNELNSKNKSMDKKKSETITSEAKMEKSVINQSSGGDSCIQQAIQLQKQSAEGLMALLRDIGQAYSDLSSYDCQAAIQNLNSLPPNQFNTSWIYCLIGLAYFEISDYESSIKYFQMVHAQDPHRMDYMDIYSTALWHLQKEVALSALAQDLINTNKNHPITWCVNGNCFSLHKEHDTAIKFFQRAVQGWQINILVIYDKRSQDLINSNKNHPITWCVNGNCFSLHKEHDTAIKFFQRAVQVDPGFPYAYTLLGHEYITTEELDKAMSCFRSAVRLNPMHYNAWFGIGTIYSKQERYNLAEMNYSRALSINPQSSVILCHIGMVQHALKQTDRALATFNKAIVNNPKSPLCKFHRGSVYFALGRHAEALKELEELKEIVPKESSVYYLIGKVHKKLGNTDLALQHFSWATDLDPKGASSQIKEAFDPAIGRNNTEVVESPQSPTPDEYHSESNSGNQGEGMNFEGLPDDSEDSVFE